MTKPELDLVISQFGKIYNNPDMLAAIALCWPNRARTEEDASMQSGMKQFVTRLYPMLFDPNLHFDTVYPTRSSDPMLFKRRKLALG